jgi:hypothetical protein
VIVCPENAGKTDPTCSGAGSDWAACSGSVDVKNPVDVKSPIVIAMHLETSFICFDLSYFIKLQAASFRVGLTAFLSGLRLIMERRSPLHSRKKPDTVFEMKESQ